MSLLRSSPVAGSMGIWPEVKSSRPSAIAWLYGPMAAGAAVVCIGFKALSPSPGDLGPSVNRSQASFDQLPFSSSRRLAGRVAAVGRLAPTGVRAEEIDAARSHLIYNRSNHLLDQLLGHRTTAVSVYRCSVSVIISEPEACAIPGNLRG